MCNKKFKYLIIVGLCSIMLSGCGDKSSSSMDINLPVENSSTSETPVENTSSSSENSESKNDENSNSKRYIYLNVHSSIIYNSQDMEAT